MLSGTRSLRVEFTTEELMTVLDAVEILLDKIVDSGGGPGRREPTTGEAEVTLPAARAVLELVRKAA